MVIDMLNMRAQVQWADKVYGKQSERIRDYTDVGLMARMDDPDMVRLREWVDPYAYRHRYTMPKLILTGTNDPYWTVDALRHYFRDLPGVTLLFQTPNAGHDLGGSKDATQTLAAFFQMIADTEALPHHGMGHPRGHARDALGAPSIATQQPSASGRRTRRIAISATTTGRAGHCPCHPAAAGRAPK